MSNSSDWVSLASVVNVAILNAQRSLVELSVRLVNQSDAERKDALVKWSERTRHELMRVLVLVRWLDAIPQVQRAWRVFGLLNDVDRTLRETADVLFLSRNAMPNAQAPPFDVRTAIDVLAHGSYSALPRCIELLTVSNNSSAVVMDADVTAAVLRRLDHALHMRLLASPTPRDVTAAQVRVHRGRLSMRVERAYSVALTLDSDSPNERWRVLEVRLLVDTAAAVTAARAAALASGAALDDIDALVYASVPLQALQRLHAVLQQRIDVAPPDDGLLCVHAVLMPLCFELWIDALQEQARVVRQRGTTTAAAAAAGAPPLQIEYDRDAPALLVQYWCRDAAAVDDAPDDGAQTSTSFTRSSSAVGVRSTTNLMKLALESASLTAQQTSAVGMHRSQSTARMRSVASTAAIASTTAGAASESDYAFCVTVRDGALVVTHVPPIAADSASAALIDEALKRLDFVALLRHVVDARAYVSLASAARAVSHVLAEQRSLSAEPTMRASVAVLRASSSLATSGSAPPRMLLQLDSATVCVLSRDRTSGAMLTSESVRDIAAFVTPDWWHAALRVGSNEIASADAADVDVVRRGCVSLWTRAALEQLRLCASARGSFAAQLQPRSIGARTTHRRQSVLIPLAGTHFESYVRICLDDTLQPVAQFVLLSSASTVVGAVPCAAASAQFDADAEYGERLVRCVPLSAPVATTNGINVSGGGGGQARRRRRLNADDAWVASAMHEGTALAWNADFDAQLVRLGLPYEQYLRDETTFALVLAGVAAPVRCTVARRAATESVEWLVNTDLGVVGATNDARLNSRHLRSSGVSGTVWSFADVVHAARGVVRTGVMAARVAAAVRSVKHAAAKSGCTVDAAGDIGVRLTLADGLTRVALGWHTDAAQSGAIAEPWIETSEPAIDRFFEPALRALLGAVDARSERHSGLHELLLGRVARLGDFARTLERLCTAFGDVRVIVLSLLGSVSVLVVILQRYGVVVRSADGRSKIRLSDAAGESATAIGGLDSWSRWIDAQHPAMAFGGATDLFDKLSVLRRTLIAVVRLADLARAVRARSSAVTQDASGRRLTFTSSSGAHNELNVEGDGHVSLLTTQSDGRTMTIGVEGLDDAPAASRSLFALTSALTFLPLSLVEDALTHLSDNVATLLLSVRAASDAPMIDGVGSDPMVSRLSMALQYVDARQQQQRLVLQLSGETGEWVWSYASITPAPVRFVQLELFDNGTERKLGFLDNFLEAQRQAAN